MKKTKIKNMKLFFIFLLIFSNSLYAGKEAGDSEIVFKNSDGSYSLASVYLEAELGEEFELSDQIKVSIVELVKQTDLNLNFEKQAWLSKSKSFKDSLFSKYNEYRLVPSSELNCKDYLDFSFDQQFLKGRWACKYGDLIFIDKDVFPKLSTLQLSLLVIYEGLRGLNIDRSMVLRKEDLQKITKTIYLSFSYFDNRNWQLPKKTEDLRALESYPSLVSKLIGAKDYASLRISEEGLFFVGDAKLLIVDDPTKKPSKISPGTVFEVNATIRNSVIRRSQFLFGDLLRKSKESYLYRMDLIDSNIENSIFHLGHSIEKDFTAIEEKEYTWGGYIYRPAVLKKHGEVWDRASQSSALIDALFELKKEKSFLIKSSDVRESQLGGSYFVNSKFESCSSVYTVSSDSVCKSTQSRLSLWLENKASIESSSIEFSAAILNHASVNSSKLLTIVVDESDLRATDFVLAKLVEFVRSSAVETNFIVRSSGHRFADSQFYKSHLDLLFDGRPTNLVQGFVAKNSSLEVVFASQAAASQFTFTKARIQRFLIDKEFMKVTTVENVDMEALYIPKGTYYFGSAKDNNELFFAGAHKLENIKVQIPSGIHSTKFKFVRSIDGEYGNYCLTQSKVSSLRNFSRGLCRR